MEYNSERSKMNISEYGRNIQKMIEYTKSIDDREKRNRLSRAIIQVMGQLNPHLRDVNDFKHKLWDHLFMISDFQLDVDSPYPIPSAETLKRKPEKLKYTTNNITFRHYGKHIERMIEKACEYPDSEKRDTLIKMIANHLKKSYLAWNRDTVTDEEIARHLHFLSRGRLSMKDNMKLANTYDILNKEKTTIGMKKKASMAKKTPRKQNPRRRSRR
ncbi:MAG: DUF4290 domain-containing protein [Bacteroidota bacterium]